MGEKPLLVSWGRRTAAVEQGFPADRWLAVLLNESNVGTVLCRCVKQGVALFSREQCTVARNDTQWSKAQ